MVLYTKFKSDIKRYSFDLFNFYLFWFWIVIASLLLIIGAIILFAFCIHDLVYIGWITPFCLGEMSFVISTFIQFSRLKKQNMQIFGTRESIDYELKKEGNSFSVVDKSTKGAVLFAVNEIKRMKIFKKTIVIHLRQKGYLQFPNIPEIKSLFSEKE